MGTITGERLSEKHSTELRIESAISDTQVAARNYESITNLRSLPLAFKPVQRMTGLLVPVSNTQGETVAWFLKPDYPRDDPKSGKPIRYEFAGRVCLDVPAAARPYLLDAEADLWITEGAKKVDSAVSHGIPCIVGLAGVWNWRQDRVALPDWSDFLLKGRKVVIAFDSDAMTNASVRKALEELAQWLEYRGAIVHYLILPDLEGGAKCGLDDAFASGLTRLDLEELVVDTLPSGEANWAAPSPLEDVERLPFPIDALAPFDPFEPFSLGLAEATQTPIDLPATVALGTLSAAAGGKFEVEVEPGYIEPANLFLLSLLPSGHRKSAVFRASNAPIVAWERDRNSSELKDKAVWESRRRVNEAKLKGMEATLATPNRKRGVDAIPINIENLELEAEALAREIAADRPPRVTQIVIDDITPERIASILSEQDGAAAVMSPEGGFFGNIGGRYSDIPSLETVLKAHAGDDIRVSRQGRAGESVPRPSLTVCICAQPSVAGELGKIPGFRGKGGAARFLVSIPKSNLGQRKPSGTPIPVDVAAAWARCVTRVLEMTPASRDEYDGYPIPHRLRLSDEARAAHVQFRIDIEPELGEFGLLADMSDWASKLAGGVARIAALLHITRHTDPQKHLITHETMKAAVEVAEYFISHAFLYFDAMAENDGSELSTARVVLEEIQRMAGDAQGLSVGRRALHQRLQKRTRFKKASTLDTPLERLEDHGFIRITTDQTGGRPSKTIHLNPLGIKGQKVQKVGAPTHTHSLEKKVQKVQKVGAAPAATDDGWVTI
jgi:hypothetical protein